MTTYTYLAADTLTGRLLAELPLSGVSYDLRVNDIPHLQATLPLDALKGIVDYITPVRTSIYVLRGDVPVFGGILWPNQYNKTARSLSIGCDGWLSYLDHLLITDDLTYTATDQLAIARSIVDYGMNKGGSNLSLAYSGATTSGVTRDQDYNAVDNAGIGQRFKELASMDGGFDYYATVRMEGNYLRRVLQLGYPTLGRTWPGSQIVFEVDADSTDFAYNEDGAATASTIYATGAAVTGSPPTYLADDSSVRLAGYPRMESAATYTSETDTPGLTARAKGDLALRRLPLATASLTIKSDPSATVKAPDLGEYLPGDQCKVRIGRGDARWPNGAEIIATITGVSVTVDDEHNDAIGVNLAPISVTPGVQR